MIKLQDYTPEIYYKQSRDFQFIGRLYDIVLNSVKTETDLLYSLPFSDTSNEMFLNLAALTLGFKPKHHYSNNQLKALCGVFAEVLKNKGTLKAIEILCTALLSAENITHEVDYTYNTQLSELNIYVPPEMTNTNLLIDLLDYILPAGTKCNIVKQVMLHTSTTTALGVADSIENYGKNTLSTVAPILGTTEERNETYDEAQVGNKVGVIINTSIYTPTDINNTEDK
jgi:hypothetical protein